jgi:hypothetical protein
MHAAEFDPPALPAPTAKAEATSETSKKERTANILGIEEGDLDAFVGCSSARRGRSVRIGG